MAMKSIFQKLRCCSLFKNTCGTDQDFANLTAPKSMPPSWPFPLIPDSPIIICKNINYKLLIQPKLVEFSQT